MMLEMFGHGGDLRTAAEVFGFPESEFLDFSANINPLGLPEAMKQALANGWDKIVHYPDPVHRSFRQAVADRLDIDPSWLLIGNGAAECIALLVLALNPQKVGVVYPCFSEYEHTAKRYGAIVTGYTGDESRDFKPSEDQVRQLLAENDLVFIGHPNNPTGITYGMDELQMMAETARIAHTILAIDEAFIDFIPEEEQHTLLPYLERYPHVVILRSLTKFYAIPGLRLGFAAAAPFLIRRMQEKQIPWSVNQLALLAGEICLQEKEYEEKTRSMINRERARLFHALSERFQCKVWPGQANYLLARLPNWITAEELQYALGKKGLLIRNCSMYPGLSPHDFRIAVRTGEENDKLIAVMSDIMETGRDGR